MDDNKSADANAGEICHPMDDKKTRGPRRLCHLMDDGKKRAREGCHPLNDTLPLLEQIVPAENWPKSKPCA
jgi:hypothetical protein